MIKHHAPLTPRRTQSTGLFKREIYSKEVQTVRDTFHRRVFGGEGTRESGVRGNRKFYSSLKLAALTDTTVSLPRKNFTKRKQTEVKKKEEREPSPCFSLLFTLHDRATSHNQQRPSSKIKEADPLSLCLLCPLLSLILRPSFSKSELKLLIAGFRVLVFRVAHQSRNGIEGPVTFTAKVGARFRGRNIVPVAVANHGYI